jgi:Ankyrin repeats (many copies)
MFSQVTAGDANGVTAHITYWPDLLFVRNRWDAAHSYSTLLHAACSSGRLDMVALLEPFPEDVTARDRSGNSCMHGAAAAANYDLCKYLAKRANMDVEAHLAQEEKRDQKISRRKISGNINVFKAARIERALVLKQIGGVRTKAGAGTVS